MPKLGPFNHSIALDLFYISKTRRTSCSACIELSGLLHIVYTRARLETRATPCSGCRGPDPRRTCSAIAMEHSEESSRRCSSCSPCTWRSRRRRHTGRWAASSSSHRSWRHTAERTVDRMQTSGNEITTLCVVVNNAKNSRVRTPVRIIRLSVDVRQEPQGPGLLAPGRREPRHAQRHRRRRRTV